MKERKVSIKNKVAGILACGVLLSSGIGGALVTGPAHAATSGFQSCGSQRVVVRVSGNREEIRPGFGFFEVRVFTNQKVQTARPTSSGGRVVNRDVFTGQNSTSWSITNLAQDFGSFAYCTNR